MKINGIQPLEIESRKISMSIPYLKSQVSGKRYHN